MAGQDAYGALRAQTTASSGTRPEPLEEVSEPLLVSTPLLADTTAETVDACTVKFLLQAALKLKKKEEEEKAEKKLEKTIEEVDVLVRIHEPALLQTRRLEEPRRAGAFQAWSDASAAGWRRKRKKRRKRRRLPFTCTPLPQQGCRRLCDHQRRVPAVLDVREPGGASDSVHLQTLGSPVATQRQGTHSAYPPGSVLGGR